MELSRAERSRAGRSRILLAALLASVILINPDWARAQEMAQGTLSAAIREAGYPCSHVTGMERSTEGAAQGLTVWVVHCNSGAYRVTFKGDTGSKVEPIE